MVKSKGKMKEQKVKEAVEFQALKEKKIIRREARWFQIHKFKRDQMWVHHIME